MKRTFTLENMEDYFRNYVPCSKHLREPITNFCSESVCLRFLCPDCVEEHSQHHTDHPVESIKTCIKRTSQKLLQTAQELETEVNILRNFKGDHSLFHDVLRQLQVIKENILAEINDYFREKENEIRKRIDFKGKALSKIESLGGELRQAISELLALKENLFNKDRTINTIKKSNSLDYKNIVHHFQSRIAELNNEFNHRIYLQFNSQKREEFKRALNSLIGLSEQPKSPEREPTPKNRVLQLNPPSERIEDRQYPRKHQELSADRMLQEGAFQIIAPNTFDGQPFLHFFEQERLNLHIFSLTQMKWYMQQLRPVDKELKEMPSFHRSIALPNGRIFVIGGTLGLDPSSMKKNMAIYELIPSQWKILPRGRLIEARSSHSVAYLDGVIYIVGGFGDGDRVLSSLQSFHPERGSSKALANCRRASANSVLAVLAGKLVKIGGILEDGNSNDYVEVYSSAINQWVEVDPQLGPESHIIRELAFYSCSGWAPLSSTEIFIFGGYNQERDNENSNQSFIFSYHHPDNYLITAINKKLLPKSGGFWNQDSVVFNSQIYCLQNVDGNQGDECAPDRKNVLVFDGEIWNIFISD